MDKFLAFLVVAKLVFLAFAHFIAPWLVAIALPSLVAALTNKPKAAGYVQRLAHFIGVLTHADEPGTLKAPFGLGYIASTGWDAFKKAVASFKAGAALALMLGALLSVSGCAWLAKHPTLNRVLKCGEQAIVQGLPSLMGDVLAALSGGSPDWASLGALEAAHGVDMVACAVKQATVQAEQIAGGSGYGAAARGAASRVSANGNAFLKARGAQ